MEDIFWLIGCLAFVAVGLWVMRHVWLNQYSPYETGAFMAAMVGDNGRAGYDASVSVGWVFTLFLALGASTFNWPLEGTALAERIKEFIIPGLLLSMVFLLSVLLFLRPRFAVPPHLRDKRGWIPEWIHSMREKRRRRRAGGSPESDQG